MTKFIEGVQVASITPFLSGVVESVEYSVLEKHFAFLVEAGVAGIVPCGTTGETSTMTHEECAEVVRVAVSACRNSDAKVIAGTGSNSTKEALMMTQRAADLGADAALVVTPYYNKPTIRGLLRHFQELNRVGIPLILYNIPSRTGVNMEPSFVGEIVQNCRNVIGIKVSNGNLDEIMQTVGIATHEDKAFSVLSGDDSLTVPIMAVGGRGVISVAANIIPKTMCMLVKSMRASDLATARSVASAIHTFVRHLLTLGSNPEPIKAIMNVFDMNVGECRLPLADISEQSTNLLRMDLQRLAEALGVELAQDRVLEILRAVASMV